MSEHNHAVAEEFEELPPWYRRRATWINLAALALLLAGSLAVLRWRQAQFEGFGLAGVYFEGQQWGGGVFRRSLDPVIDFSDKEQPIFKRGSFSVEWTGSILLPRSGRYSFALESDDGSTLELDGRMMVNNGGTHGVQRREAADILPSGIKRVRLRYFQAGMGAEVRLFWSPAGRRGGLEPVPPTVLRPEPPERLSRRDFYPVPPRDFAAIVLLLGLLALTIGVWARGPLGRTLAALRDEPGVRRDLALFLGLFVLALAVRLWDLGGAGRTWDEDVYWTAGRNFMQNLLGGVFRAEAWAWNNEHPAVAKWLFGPATLLSDSFTPARAVSVALGALTCALVYLAGRDLLGGDATARRVGLIGGALAAVTPHIIAHHKIIGLETPTGLFYTLGVWLFFRSMARPGKNSGLHLLTGLCLGLVVGTRVSNLSLVLVLLGLYLAVHRRRIVLQRVFPLPVTLGLLPVVALLAFVGLWPYLWDNPMKHLGEMLTHWKPDIFLEWFLGKKQPPKWFYFPLYFGVTMPVVMLGCFGLSAGRLLARRDRGHLTLLGWFLAPFLVMASPLARDGVRYLYPALFPACLLAAVGLDGLCSLISRLARRSALQTPLAAVLGVALLVYTFHAGTRVHPYYLDYYNELTGGPARVAQRHTFEIGWWGEGLKEAGDYLARNAPRGATVKVYVHPTHVVNLREDLRWWDVAHTADYILFNNLFNTLPENLPHHVVHVVRAAGAPLVWVYQRNDLKPRDGESEE